jgi:hypothetical protein
MRIIVSLATIPPGCRLVEADDCTSLSVEVVRVEHAFIAPEVLQAMAAREITRSDWPTRFGAMLDYARSKGWTDTDGAVRAHVVW